MEDQHQYLLTREQLLKLAEFVGDAKWIWRRTRLYEGSLSTLGSLCTISAVLLAFIYSGIESTRNLRHVIVVYWMALTGIGLCYSLLRHWWGQIKREDFRKEAEKEMILGMEDAKIKTEIDQLTRGIE